MSRIQLPITVDTLNQLIPNDESLWKSASRIHVTDTMLRNYGSVLDSLMKTYRIYHPLDRTCSEVNLILNALYGLRQLRTAAGMGEVKFNKLVKVLNRDTVLGLALMLNNCLGVTGHECTSDVGIIYDTILKLLDDEDIVFGEAYLWESRDELMVMKVNQVIYGLISLTMNLMSHLLDKLTVANGDVGALRDCAAKIKEINASTSPECRLAPYLQFVGYVESSTAEINKANNKIRQDELGLKVIV